MNLPKVYEPGKYEKKTYELWEQSGAFAPSKGKGQFSIVMPPPNANAPLHTGHALMVVLEDLMVRYHRLKGDSTLFLPGADHAGFETQAVFERQLEKEGKSRFDYNREQLFKQIWDFVAANRDTMLNQMRWLGASVDWQRLTFTLDEQVVKTTYDTFKKLWDDDLIYRGERLVNYCTFHRTGFADIEVVYEDKNQPLYYLKYGPFVLATTRPETKFGDTAVAVHPKDARYKQWIGKAITAEGVNGPFDIQVVADDMVDMEFGTGVVKITPAHDFNDWEVAQRHGLPAVRVINHDGTMNHHAGRFEGLSVLEAREAVVKALKDKNLLDKVDESYKTRVGVCYKCGTVIEPMLMDQWFVKTEPLAKEAIKAVKSEKIAFHPKNKADVLVNYYQNLKDWNISRQIAWGIPIPAFQNINDTDEWIFDTRVEQELIEVKGQHYRRDPDVFDTWFSSGQWPFATLGYPDGQDYKDFYPLSVMETGGDILFPWVSRMIMLGLYVTKKVPFTTVYLHGLVTDPEGKKMSKSRGNVVNPMDMLQQYGSDALRMGLIAGRSAGLNQAFDESKVVGGRNFANKLWNIARYIEGAVGAKYQPGAPMPKSPADHWWLARLNEGTANITKNMDEYRFSEAYETLYQLIWNDFADWYLEASKTALNPSVLAHGLNTLLTLAHPFAPFVTETIWQTLGWSDGLLITRRWPESAKADAKAAAGFEPIKKLITEIRDLYNRLKLRENTLYHKGDPFIEANADVILKMTKLAGIDKVKGGRGLKLTQAGVDAWLDVEFAVIANYASDLEQQQGEIGAQVKQLQDRLSNPAYAKKAPKQLVKQTKAQLDELRTRQEQVSQQLSAAKTSLRD